MGVFAGPFVVVGLLLVLYGGRLLWTGKNFSGFLGRGFTKGDELRMKRAPATFFRAVGTVASLCGLFLIFMGSVFAFDPNRPDKHVDSLVLAVAGVFIIMFVASTVRLLLIAGKYRLFRWDKP